MRAHQLIITIYFYINFINTSTSDKTYANISANPSEYPSCSKSLGPSNDEHNETCLKRKSDKDHNIVFSNFLIPQKIQKSTTENKIKTQNNQCSISKAKIEIYDQLKSNLDNYKTLASFKKFMADINSDVEKQGFNILNIKKLVLEDINQRNVTFVSSSHFAVEIEFVVKTIIENNINVKSELNRDVFTVNRTCLDGFKQGIKEASEHIFARNKEIAISFIRMKSFFQKHIIRDIRPAVDDCINISRLNLDAISKGLIDELNGVIFKKNDFEYQIDDNLVNSHNYMISSFLANAGIIYHNSLLALAKVLERVIYLEFQVECAYEHLCKVINDIINDFNTRAHQCVSLKPNFKQTIEFLLIYNFKIVEKLNKLSEKEYIEPKIQNTTNSILEFLVLTQKIYNTLTRLNVNECRCKADKDAMYSIVKYTETVFNIFNYDFKKFRSLEDETGANSAQNLILNFFDWIEVMISYMQSKITRILDDINVKGKVKYEILDLSTLFEMINISKMDEVDMIGMTEDRN